MLVASCDGKVHCWPKVPPARKNGVQVRYAGELLKLQMVSAPLDRHRIRVYTYIMNTKFVCTCTTVRHAAQTLTEVYDRVLAPSGLKVTQYMLLRSILRGETEKSITELAQALGSDRSTIGRNLRILSRDGLVSSRVGDDRREHVVRVTEKGRQAVACASPLWQQAQRAVADALGQDQLEVLRALLSRLEETSV
jgi:DNA-binding MarR family transcriptional regulator